MVFRILFFILAIVSAEPVLLYGLLKKKKPEKIAGLVLLITLFLGFAVSVPYMSDLSSFLASLFGLICSPESWFGLLLLVYPFLSQSLFDKNVAAQGLSSLFSAGVQS